MSFDQGTSERALSSCFDPENSRIHGDEVVPEIEEIPPPELWCPIRPFAEIIAGRHNFCQVPTNVVFRLPSIVEILDRSGVSISQISPLGLKHIVGMLVLGYERGVDLTADYLESLFCLYRTRVENLYDFWLRPQMAIGKGFATNDRGWKDYFFFVCLDEASVSEECHPVFRRSWGRRAVALYRPRSGPSIEEDAELSVEDPILSGFHAQGRSSGLG
ncbi:hypothetical protein F2Q70_00004781 [Brassica cretica]|uniref:Uncharacterized protein n=1 Tax=Brassica cretica TaxID=69181 RepID=A0A8S9IVM2_BRACR|nr:hypothetical protein F2Q70_00004781 [Brassica cretica]